MTEGNADALLVQPRAGRQVGFVGIDFGTTSATATLHDSRQARSQAVWPAQAAVLCDGLAELLRGGTPDPWPHPDAADDVARRVGAALRPGDLKVLDTDLGSAAALADALEHAGEQERRDAARPARDPDHEERAARERLFTTTLLELERLLVSTARLGRALHHLCRGAFATVPLDAYELVAVPVGASFEEAGSDPTAVLGRIDPGTDRDVVSTLVLVPNSRPVRGHLQEWSDATVQVFPAVKRHLSRPRALPAVDASAVPRGWTADTNLLLGLSYADLARRIRGYADVVAALPSRSDRDPVADGAPAVVDRVTATYPTITPPASRERLRGLIATALGLERRHVDVACDEGVAAALYFVMRELSGDRRGGVEALRARSRTVAPAHWRRTLLVVDIGGGTTDIALIGLDLRLTARPADPFAGASYELTPQVLGTTGHAQLGGDVLTLRVFYWIKAVLADWLLRVRADAGAEHPDARNRPPTLAQVWPGEATGRSVPAELAPLVTASTDVDPAPPAVRAALRRLLPTHTVGADKAANNAAFHRLWTQAERAKRALANGTEVRFEPEWLVTLIGELALPWLPSAGDLAQLAPPPLPPEEFLRLARPMLETAMETAAALARRRLGESTDPVLDLVALAGRSCGMPQAPEVARETVSRVLAGEHGESGRVSWDPSAVVVERENAKQAASIGAVWRYSRVNFQAETPGAGEPAGVGDDRVALEIDNLVLDLPCAFEYRAPDGGRVPLLDIGTPLDRRRPDETRFVRSRWFPAMPKLDLLRVVGPGAAILWSEFRYTDHSEGLRPDTRFRIEVDQELTPTLLVRRGAEEHLTAEQAREPVDLRRALRSVLVEGHLDGIPEITVSPDPRGTGAPPERRAEPAFDPAAGPNRWLHLTPGSFAGRPAPAAPLRCAVARDRIADPPSWPAGPRRYVVSARERPGGDWVAIAVVSVPEPGPGPVAGVGVALGADGFLHLLHGRPQPLWALDVPDMERSLGATFRTSMTAGETDWIPCRDPFNGTH